MALASDAALLHRRRIASTMRSANVTRGLTAVLLAATCGTSLAGESWKAVPLRTAAQKREGFAGGEMGQMGFCLTISKKDPRRLAMSLDTAGIYLSVDGGATWQIRRSGLRSNGANSVAFDPENANVLYAAANKNIPGDDPYDPAADGIYRSTDLGATWQRVFRAGFQRAAGQNEYFAFAAASGGVSQTIWAITHDQGLVRSEDGGTTWARVPTPPAAGIGNAVLRDPTHGALWLAASGGLWRSHDSGATWARMGGGLPGGAVKGLALHPRDAAIVYAALGRSGVWRTADGGESWRRTSRGLPAADWTRLARGAGSILWADAAQTDSLPYRTADEGATWSKSVTKRDGYYRVKWWSEGLVAHPTEGDTAYFIPEVRMTRDGGRSWPVHGAGVSGSRLSSRTAVAWRGEDPARLVFFHTDWGSSLTRDGGDTWQWRPAPRQSFGAWTQPGGAYDSTPGSRTLVSAVGGWDAQVLCRSRNDGRSWEVVDSVRRAYTFFAWHPRNGSVLYVGHSAGGLRSEDAARTWQALAQPVRAMFRGDGDIVYALARPTSAASRVLKSTDRGRHWSRVGADIAGEIKDIDVDPVDSDRLYAAGVGGVWVHDGSSWNRKGTADGLENDVFGGLHFASVAADPRIPGVVYAGQNVCWRGVARGVYRSTDHGRTWRNLNLNLGNDLTVWGLSVTPDGTAWLGTDHGTFRLAPD
jgi:photosystem II stability/assembly factor-like uncharacterized protein